MGRSFSGSTAGASAVILASRFWREGTTLTGRFLRSYEAKMKDGSSAEVNQFKTFKPEILTVPMTNGRYDENGEPTKCDKFSIGALSGWEMALDDARIQGFTRFYAGDYVTVKCVGFQQSA